MVEKPLNEPLDQDQKTSHRRRVIPPIPRPPVKTMTDFVVFSFVSIVVFVLMSAVLGILITTLVSPDKDNSQTIAILADVTTSLIAALVGFLAGKGTGHQEAVEQRAAEVERDREWEFMNKEAES